MILTLKLMTQFYTISSLSFSTSSAQHYFFVLNNMRLNSLWIGKMQQKWNRNALVIMLFSQYNELVSITRDEENEEIQIIKIIK